MNTEQEKLNSHGKWLEHQIDYVTKQRDKAPNEKQKEFYWKIHTLRDCLKKVKDFKVR